MVLVGAFLRSKFAGRVRVPPHPRSQTSALLRATADSHAAPSKASSKAKVPSSSAGNRESLQDSKQLCDNDKTAQTLQLQEIVSIAGMTVP